MFHSQRCCFRLPSGARQAFLKLIPGRSSRYLCFVQDQHCFSEEYEHAAWQVSAPSLVHLLSILLPKVKDKAQLRGVSKIVAVALEIGAMLSPCSHTRHSKFF